MQAVVIRPPAPSGGRAALSAPRVTLRIDFPTGRSIGPGKARLLELVAEHGSISAAGRAMGMSYRRAWLLIDDLNSTFRTRLVQTHTGGASGGSATLTEMGHEVVAIYRDAERQTAALAAVPKLVERLAENTSPITP
jgi:molybdate transport system regulatory protein